MSVIIILLIVSICIAGGFLIAFLWSVKDGQFDDVQSPAQRMLFENIKNKVNCQKGEKNNASKYTIAEIKNIKNLIKEGKGVVEIAKMLSVNSCLHTLVLYNNNIGDEGAVEIAKCLSTNNCLHTLYLNDNNISYEDGNRFFNKIWIEIE